MAQERAAWESEVRENPTITQKDVAALVGCPSRGAAYIIRTIEHYELGGSDSYRTSKKAVESWMAAMGSLRPQSLRYNAGVYFLGCGDAVKIGVTNNHHRRRVAIQKCNPDPVSLLLVFPGDEAVEAYFHGRFWAHRIHSEWFRREGSLDEFLRGHKR
jgi:hypothetical protein